MSLSHPPMALKASRKPIKLLILARVPAHPCPSLFNRDPTDLADQTWHFRHGTDDGPGDEAPGDADRGIVRPGAGRHDREFLADQPRRVASGGGGADPRGHGPRP